MAGEQASRVLARVRTISRQNGGRSSGFREVIRLPSTTTSLSDHRHRHSPSVAASPRPWGGSIFRSAASREASAHDRPGGSREDLSCLTTSFTASSARRK